MTSRCMERMIIKKKSKAIKKKEREITWLDTYCEGGYSYEEYVENCEDNGIEPAEEGSDAYWSWIEDMISDDVECFFDNLKYSDVNKQAVVISGHLGLWWGSPTIQEEMCDSLSEAVKKCWGDCDAVEVTSFNGSVRVRAMHHDGTNCFEIRPLTERGEELMREGEPICVGNHWHTGKFPKYLY